MAASVQQLLLAVAAAGGGGAPTPPPGTWLGLWDARSGLTLSGSSITNVTDLSGNGNHLGDGSATGKPTYDAMGLNSRPTMVFNNQSIAATSAFPMGTGNTLTFFVVGTLSSSSASNGRLISYYTGVNSDFSDASNWIFARNGGGASAMLMRTSVSQAQTVTYDTPYRFIGTIDSGGAMKLYLNGSASAGATSGGNWSNNGTLAIGISVSDFVKWFGSVSQIGISTLFTNSTDVATLDSFLQADWGL